MGQVGSVGRLAHRRLDDFQKIVIRQSALSGKACRR
jgi:hypothetical protein